MFLVTLILCIPDHHPAIVERAVFDTVQASQLRFSQPNKKKRDYPLKGKAFCGCCGHALRRTMQKTSYYYCRHSEADEESRCHKMRLNAAELEQIIAEEKLKPAEAQRFVANAFRDGALKTTGTDIDQILPPVSRFGGGNRTEKKKTIIQRLAQFFEKYFGI